MVTNYFHLLKYSLTNSITKIYSLYKKVTEFLIELNWGVYVFILFLYYKWVRYGRGWEWVLVRLFEERRNQYTRAVFR